MAIKFDLSAHLQVQRFSISPSVKKELQKAITISAFSPGTTAIRQIRKDIQAHLDKSKFLIKNIIVPKKTLNDIVKQIRDHLNNAKFNVSFRADIPPNPPGGGGGGNTKGRISNNQIEQAIKNFERTATVAAEKAAEKAARILLRNPLSGRIESARTRVSRLVPTEFGGDFTTLGPNRQRSFSVRQRAGTRGSSLVPLGPSISTGKYREADEIIGEFTNARLSKALDARINAPISDPSINTGLKKAVSKTQVVANDLINQVVTQSLNQAKRTAGSRRLDDSNIFQNIATGSNNRDRFFARPTVRTRQIEQSLFGNIPRARPIDGGGGPPRDPNLTTPSAEPFKRINFRQLITDQGRLNQIFKENISELERFGRVSGATLRRFTAYSVVTSLFYRLTDAVSNATREFIEFDHELVRIAQVTQGSAADLASIETTVRDISTRFGTNSLEILKAGETLAQAGVAARDLPTILEGIAKSDLSPTFENIAATTEGLIAIMNQFNTSASQTEAVLGSINAVSARYAVESGDILQAVRRAGGAFAAASADGEKSLATFQEFAAAFTSVRQTTRESAESIATAMRTIVTRVQRDSTTQFLKDRGVDILNAEGNFAGFTNTIIKLNEAFVALDKEGRGQDKFAILEEVGGFRQLSKLLPLIEQVGTFQEALGVSLLGTSSLDKDVITANNSISISFNRLGESFKKLIGDFGRDENIKNFIKTITEGTAGILNFASSLSVVATETAALGASFLVLKGSTFARGLVTGLSGATDARGDLINQSISSRNPSVFVNRQQFGNISRAITPDVFNQGNKDFFKSLRNTGVSRQTILSGLPGADLNPRQAEVFGGVSQLAGLRRNALALNRQIRQGRSSNVDVTGLVGQRRDLQKEINAVTESLVKNNEALKGSTGVVNKFKNVISNISTLRGVQALGIAGLAGGGLLSANSGELKVGGDNTGVRNLRAAGGALAAGGVTAIVGAEVFSLLGIALTGPVGIVVGALGLLGAGIYGAYRSLSNTSEEIDELNYQAKIEPLIDNLQKVDEQLKKSVNIRERRSIAAAGLIRGRGSLQKALQQDTAAIDPTRPESENILLNLATQGIQASDNPDSLVRGKEIYRIVRDVTNARVARLNITDETERGIRDKEIETELLNNFKTIASTSRFTGELGESIRRLISPVDALSNTVKTLSVRLDVANDVLNQPNVFAGNTQGQSFTPLVLNRLFQGVRSNSFGSLTRNLSQDFPEIGQIIIETTQVQQNLANTINSLAKGGFAGLTKPGQNRDELIKDQLLGSIGPTGNAGLFRNALQTGIAQFLSSNGQSLDQVITDAVASGTVDQLVEELTRIGFDFKEIAQKLADFRQSILPTINRTADDFATQGDEVINLQREALGISAGRNRIGRDISPEQRLGTEQAILSSRVLNLAGTTNIADISRAAFNQLGTIDTQRGQVQQTETDFLLGKATEDELFQVRTAFRASEQTLRDYQEALKELSRTQEISAAITEKQNQLEQQKQGLIGLGEKIFTGDQDSIRRLQFGIGLFQRITNQGGLQNSGGLLNNRDNREILVEVGRLLSDVNIPGRDQTFGKVLDKVLLNTVDPRLQGQFQNQQDILLDQQRGLIDLSASATSALTDITTQSQQLMVANAARIVEETKAAFEKGLVAEVIQVFGTIDLKNIKLEPVTGIERASGGFVYGKAGRDKIPAMLTNGEFVVNAESSKKFAPLLKQINEGGMRLANGGSVGPDSNFKPRKGLDQAIDSYLKIQMKIAEYLNNGPDLTDVAGKGSDVFEILLEQRGIAYDQVALFKGFEKEIARSKKSTASANFIAKNGVSPSPLLSSLPKKSVTVAGGFLPTGGRLPSLPDRSDFTTGTPIEPVEPIQPLRPVGGLLPASIIGSLFGNKVFSENTGTPSASGPRVPLPFPSEIPSSKFPVQRTDGNESARRKIRSRIGSSNNFGNSGFAAGVRSDALGRKITEREARKEAFEASRRFAPLRRQVGNLNIDQQAVDAVNSGGNIRAIANDIRIRNRNNQLGENVIDDRGFKLNNEQRQKQNETNAELANQMKNFPRQVEVKLGDINVNLNGGDFVKNFNESFVNAVADKVADQIKAQGSRLFRRTPN